MPTKNKSYFNQLAEVAHKPIVTAKIDRLVNSPNTHIKAYATVNLGGAFVVHDVKIVDGQKGLFVQMPQTTFKKDGKVTYQDVFHAVTADARSEMNAKVLDAFQQKLMQDAANAQAQDSYPVLDHLEPEDPLAGMDDPGQPEMTM